MHYLPGSVMHWYILQHEGGSLLFNARKLALQQRSCNTNKATWHKPAALKGQQLGTGDCVHRGYQALYSSYKCCSCSAPLSTALTLHRGITTQRITPAQFCQFDTAIPTLLPPLTPAQFCQFDTAIPTLLPPLQPCAPLAFKPCILYSTGTPLLQGQRRLFILPARNCSINSLRGASSLSSTRSKCCTQ